MTDVYFNEASVPSSLNSDLIDNLICQYAQVIKEAKNQGFGTVRYENGVESIMLGDKYSLAQYLYEHRTAQSVNVILTTQSKPYIPDDDSAEDAYILNNFVVEVGNEQVKSEGFAAAAAIHNSMVIGLDNPYWHEESYNVIESDGNKTRKIKVLYASDESFFASEAFQLWSDENLPPTILSSGMLPNEKEIHLSRHHGYDVLMRFAKRIRKESYIKAVLNSIDRDPNQKKFARGRVGSNIVDITLIKEDYYGMAVSTTARNDKELRCIVRLLTEKYS